MDVVCFIAQKRGMVVIKVVLRMKEGEGVNKDACHT